MIRLSNKEQIKLSNIPNVSLCREIEAAILSGDEEFIIEKVQEAISANDDILLSLIIRYYNNQLPIVAHDLIRQYIQGGNVKESRAGYIDLGENIDRLCKKYVNWLYDKFHDNYIKNGNFIYNYDINNDSETLEFLRNLNIELKKIAKEKNLPRNNFPTTNIVESMVVARGQGFRGQFKPSSKTIILSEYLLDNFMDQYTIYYKEVVEVLEHEIEHALQNQYIEFKKRPIKSTFTTRPKIKDIEVLREHEQARDKELENKKRYQYVNTNTEISARLMEAINQGKKAAENMLYSYIENNTISSANLNEFLLWLWNRYGNRYLTPYKDMAMTPMKAKNFRRLYFLNMARYIKKLEADKI